jgi:hypothetical protein
VMMNKSNHSSYQTKNRADMLSYVKKCFHYFFKYHIYFENKGKEIKCKDT